MNQARKQHMKKAQTAMEFLVLTMFMVFVFTGFFFVVQQRASTANQEARQSEIEAAADVVNQEVANAFRVQDGYQRIFETPLTINNEPYTMTINDKNEITFRT